MSLILLPQDGKTRCTTGSVVSSLYHLKDTEHNNEDAGFFVFPDLSVRTEGSYRYVPGFDSSLLLYFLSTVWTLTYRS